MKPWMGEKMREGFTPCEEGALPSQVPACSAAGNMAPFFLNPPTRANAPSFPKSLFEALAHNWMAAAAALCLLVRASGVHGVVYVQQPWYSRGMLVGQQDRHQGLLSCLP